MDYYTLFWKRYFDFRGVTSRKDFWLTTLVNIIFCSILHFIIVFRLPNGVGGYTPITLGMLFFLIICIPTIAMTVRRLHDAKLSGLLVLITLIPMFGSIIILIMNLIGAKHDNNKWYDYDTQKGKIK